MNDILLQNEDRSHNHWWIQRSDGDSSPHPLGPISSIFMQFSAKILPNNRFWPEFRGWRPPPRLGNLGFDTDINTQILSSSPANPSTRGQKFNQQECIPVVCVPPAHSPHGGVCLGGGGVCPEGVCPEGCLPRGVGCLPGGGVPAQGDVCPCDL